MFSTDTIKKVVSELKVSMKAFETIAKINVNVLSTTITSGNRKIGHVMNVSLAPVLTCANCKECKYLCYDIKACLAYKKSVIPARAKNTVLALKYPEKYFSDIRKKLKNRKSNYFFRWHVAGDIPNMSYFENMVKIAKDFPNYVFWTYTKNYALINLYCEKYGKNSIPKNLSIMFSEWRGMAMPNPYNFPVFHVVFKTDSEKPKGFYCPGNCGLCLKSKTGCPYGKNVNCHEH